MNEDRHSILKELPSVDELVLLIQQKKVAESYSHRHIVTIARNELETLRAELINGKSIPSDLTAYLEKKVEKSLMAILAPSLRRVVNLTGIFVHTNLGRSPLMQDAVEALDTSAHYCNLEYDLSKRGRGKRDKNLERLLPLLTGCANFLLTNNNAAALFLILNTFARGKKVAVSRGELIEIGGSFRIPDIMRASGAKLVEVGTTNRTRISDFQTAIDDGAKMLLKVHTSNYRIEGFSESAPVSELVELARSNEVMCVEDLGSGSFIDISKWGLPKEPTVQDSLSSGVDLVCFSVDKLLGGPQGGLVFGKKEYVAKMNKNPIKRVVRAGKLTILALEATLRNYLNEEKFMKSHPLYRNLLVEKDELESRGKEFIKKLKEKFGDSVEYLIREDKCYIGGGSLPEQAIDTMVLELTPVKIKLNKLLNCFYDNNPPIIGRVSNEKLLLDLRQLENIDDGVPSQEL
ncbi:MAG: L-seryl-tRNA(Sec) selenium transferase [bacterium]